MAWERYRPTPSKNTIRYRNTETGQTISRRQYEKQTFTPTRYAQYYRKGVISTASKKFTKIAKTRHKSYIVGSLGDIERVLYDRKPPGDATAFIRITHTGTGKTAQTNSVFASGDYAQHLLQMAVEIYMRYWGERDLSDEYLSELDELDELDDEIASDGEFEIEIVYVTDL